MRIMRKRIIAMLCICMCVLGLAACGTDPKSVDYNGKTYAELEEYAKTTWEGIKSMDLSQMEPIVAEIDAMSEAERIALMKANEGLECVPYCRPFSSREKGEALWQRKFWRRPIIKSRNILWRRNLNSCPIRLKRI